MTPFPPAFAKLRNTRLDLIRRADWDAWYAAMLPWLLHDDAAVRGACLERLVTGVFWAEGEGPKATRAPAEHMLARTRWLLDEVTRAQAQWPGTMACLMRLATHKLPTDAALHLFGNWLAAWGPSPDLPAGMMAGTHLLIRTRARDIDESDLITALDDDDAYVRACAARCLAMVSEGTDADVLDLISAQERRRPGVAGPFWSEWQYCVTDDGFDAALWMMDLLDTRVGEVPADLPFNDIAFYLHELCDHAPDLVRRMMAAGRLDLAVETATEARCIVPGMAEVLQDLCASDDAGVAERAGRYLAQYHGLRHPAMLHVANVLPLAAGARVIGLRFACAVGRWDMVVFFAADDAPFDEGEADRLAALVSPPAARGGVVAPLGAFSDLAPLVLQRQRIAASANHGWITCDGDTEKALWHRIEVNIRGGIDDATYQAIA